jgi:TM2 domain-containing membrane protein YozV
LLLFSALIFQPFTEKFKMANYFYTDANGQRQQINDQQLQALAAKGIITPSTPLEAEGGHQGVAGQIPGLKFNTAAPPPFAQPVQAAQATNLFCTNCGKPVSEHAVACMTCGAKPVGHKKFCRQCGVALNPEQVVCIKCGAAVKATGASRSVGGGGGGGTSWEKKKLVAGLLAIIFGSLGAHKYYMGSWGWGIVFSFITIFLGLLTLGVVWVIMEIIAIVEGIMFLVMSEETFAEKYPPETEQPFRW